MVKFETALSGLINMIYVKSIYNSFVHKMGQVMLRVPSEVAMKTSSNGNIFCVTGPLCKEFTGHRVTRSFDVFFDLCFE